MRITIRTRILFIFVGVALIQALLLGAFFLHQHNKTNQNLVTQQLQATSKNINTQLSIFLNSLLQDLETASQQVERMAQKNYQQYNLLKTLKNNNKAFSALNFYDINGFIKSSVSSATLENIPESFIKNTALFNFPYQTGKPYVCQLETTENKLAFGISQPIHFLDNSYIVGVISALISYDTIQDVIDQTALPPHLNILILNSEGIVIAQHLSSPNTPPHLSFPVEQVWDGDIVLDHIHYVSVSSLLDFHGQQLTIVSNIDIKQSLAPTVRSFMLLIFIVLLLLVLSALVGWTTNKKIIEPLQLLADISSTMIQSKENDILLPQDAELHDLAATLNDLNNQLRASNSSLEGEVQKRRREEKSAILAKIEAEKANQAKSIFLANMIHEIRTPLHGMIGMLAMMSNDSITRQQQQLLSMTITAGQRLQTVVDSILDLSQIESGKFQLHSSPFSLSDLVLEVVEFMQVQVKTQNKDISISSKQAENIPNALIGDSGRIRQILINLINNSIKFSKKGSIWLKIELQSQPTQQKVSLLFTIKDNGYGIAEESKNSIFDAFERGRLEKEHVIEGTGLGLFISSEFVQHMQGKLWLESTSKDGSTFCFTILCELDQEERSQVVEELETSSQVKVLDGIRIFLAEDEFINQRIISAYLEEQGGAVTVCANGQELLDAMQEGSADIILMDIRMPVLNGIETTKIIRENEKGLSLLPIPIVALTAQATTDFEEQCKNAGMNAYLTKPIHFKKLVDIICEYVGK